MTFWPFKRKVPEQLTAAELRDRLIMAAASGSRKDLIELCSLHKAQVAANVEFFCTAPKDIRADAAAIDNQIQCLGIVAQCLANDCGAPELWNRLCGTTESNPLLRWQAWFGEVA